VDFLSPFILEGVRKRGIAIPAERARITACSFTDYAKCKAGKKDKLSIAFAGRLEKDKNPMLYLDAVSPLAAKYPNVEFHIMGEGRLSSAVEEKVNSLGLPNIIFHGFVPNPTEIFSETSVFVSIQTTNNYPSQSVLEAMACENAVIATDVGDTRMFINENNGTLISLEKEQLQRAIEKYILNPEVALEKGKYASQYVRREFTIEKAADYYLGLFEMAAKKAQTGKK
jgi:glycosyltransferase involved in cell wall biosynthesis